MSITSNQNDLDERDAMKYVQKVKRFFLTLIQFTILISGLLIINLLASPDYLWVKWPATGLGLYMILRGFNTFNRITLFDQKWEKDQLEKRLNNMRRSK